MTKTNSDIMHDIEGKHFGRCLDQRWGVDRRTLVELMDYPKGRCQAVITKHYDRPVPRSGNGKPWPELIACHVYVPVDPDNNTWTGLDDALQKFESNRAKVTVL